MRQGAEEGPIDALMFVARRALKMLRDPRSNVARLARLLDTTAFLAEAVTANAQHLYSNRGRVETTAHAITLIGFERTERVVLRAVRYECARLRDRQRARGFRSQPDLDQAHRTSA